MKRSGTTNLPLHYGFVPRWLADRMKDLGREISLAVIYTCGRDEFLRRISDPFWFQSLGSVMGMDWHSSGITPSVMAALSKGLNPLSHETGLYILGGRGKYSRNTPSKITDVSMKTGLDGDKLVRCSRLSAKIDNTCIQDGYQIYMHNFILACDEKWSVVQQGMNREDKTARRYHWHSDEITSFVDDPHTAIVGINEGEILNLSDTRADAARRSIVEFLSIHPDKQLTEIKSLFSSRHLDMPAHHDVKEKNVNSKRLGAVLALAYEKQFRDFTDALLLNGVGPRTIQSLALVSEVIYGRPARFSDPARFSFAHGGKDGHPFPVPTKIYDETITVLEKCLRRAHLEHNDRENALRRLTLVVRHIESQNDPMAHMEPLIRREWRESARNGGMVAGSRSPSRRKKGNRDDDGQLTLF